MKKSFFCTLGPTSFNEKTISRLDELGAALFRINLSHTKLEDLEDRVGLIRRYSQVPICFDTRVEEGGFWTGMHHSLKGLLWLPSQSSITASVLISGDQPKLQYVFAPQYF